MTPLHRLNKTKEILITCHKRLFKIYELNYTFPIFENESNVKENIKRETLFKEWKLKENKEDPNPILLQLVINNQKEKKIQIYNKNVDDNKNNNYSNIINFFYKCISWYK